MKTLPLTTDQAYVLNNCVENEIATLTKDLIPLRKNPPHLIGEIRVVAALEGKLRMLSELSDKLHEIAFA